MKLRIRLHPDAAREVEQAHAYYAKVDPDLGEAFIRELELTFQNARRLPQSGRAWQGTEPGRRVYLLARFPFLVIARTTSSELRVLAVAHQRRRPGYWLERERD